MTIPDIISGLPVTSIGNGAFSRCASLTSITIPNSVTNVGYGAFGGCSGLTAITIPSSVTSIRDNTFYSCISLTSVSIPASVASIGGYAFYYCRRLTNVTIPNSVTRIGDEAFNGCSSLTSVSIPDGVTSIGNEEFSGCTSLGSVTIGNRVTNIGNYASGTVTSSPAMLNVIAPVERRPVPGVKVMAQAGSLLNVGYADSLSPAPNWIPLGSVSLTSTPQYCFDVTVPLPPQRFYWAWQSGTPSVMPSLDLHPVPAITLTGAIGGSVRLDYINQFGPIDAWVTLATVPLTNTSQLYFDISAPGQPQRLYRVVQMP